MLILLLGLTCNALSFQYKSNVAKGFFVPYSSNYGSFWRTISFPSLKTVALSQELDYGNPKYLESKKKLQKLDKEFLSVAFPAFLGLVADPLASIVDAIYVGRLGPASQAGMGIAISAQYSVAKLYNDPLIKTSTSLVAGKSDDELSASVSTAILTAIIIGTMQFFVYLFFSDALMNVMGVALNSDMRKPAIDYLRWRAAGVPAATVLLVSNGIFRGRGDTKTPLFCTILATTINIILDPILIFTCGMGCAGAGAATSISQWIAVIPQIIFLHRSIPFKLFGSSGQGSGSQVFQTAAKSYAKAGSLVLLRTIAKIAAYSFTASAAAKLGSISMAAYSLTFNLGFATSQLCEAVSIAAQALLARDFPFNTTEKRISAGFIIRRSLQYGLFTSCTLTLATLLNQNNVLNQMTKSPAVRAAAAAVMPVVLWTQIFKSLAYSTNGVLLGGLDWVYSSTGMTAASLVLISLLLVLPNTLKNIWISLAAFMASQVIISSARFMSQRGPWKGIDFSGKVLHKVEVDDTNHNSNSNSNNSINDNSSTER